MPSVSKLLFVLAILLVIMWVVNSGPHDSRNRWREAWCILGYKAVDTSGVLILEKWGEQVGSVRNAYIGGRANHDIADDIAMQAQMHIMLWKTSELWKKMMSEVPNSETCVFEVTYLYIACLNRRAANVFTVASNRAISGVVTCTINPDGVRSYMFNNTDALLDCSAFRLIDCPGDNAYIKIEYDGDVNSYHLDLQRYGIPPSIGSYPIGKVIRLDTK